MGPVLGYRVWPAPQPGKYGGRLTHGSAGETQRYSLVGTTPRQRHKSGSGLPSLDNIHEVGGAASLHTFASTRIRLRLPCALSW